jgi:glyoxylase-like metal-dependent hydrolase (beta-lactamase superfamily II)
LAATQWSYNGAEGIPATIASLLDLKEKAVSVLMPSHGEVITDVSFAVDDLIEKLWKLLRLRGQNPRLFNLRENPYETILPHLLKHRASMANSYVLLSQSGKALMIDFGYDFMTGIPAGSDRASRRPWLYTLPTLKKQFGVKKIDVVIPTHYHDDHVAGFNLLRDVEGTQTWVPENFADILENPSDYDLPCLWYDSIPVDRILALDASFIWEEYTLALYPLPGHTRYAMAVFVEVDGKRVLAVGDQYQNDNGLLWNYVYQNRYQIGDYIKTAALYQRLQPELILPGHWQPFEVTAKYLEVIMEQAVEMENLQNSLLPEDLNLGSEGFIARIHPYQTIAKKGSLLTFTVEIYNPYPESAEFKVGLFVPAGWGVTPIDQQGKIEQSLILTFHVSPPLGLVIVRERIAVEVSIGHHHFGQQAEALITLKEESQNEE